MSVNLISYSENRCANDFVGNSINYVPEKEKMRKEMEEEIRAQLEANAMAMMSWDEKVWFDFLEMKYLFQQKLI